MTTPFLSIQAIRKSYGNVVALESVSIDVAKGEFLTFLGPSGSGKSTTLYVIAGFLEPSAGDVLLEGASILTIPSNKRNIGMVFQRYTLFPHLSVAENVAFPLRVRRQPKAEIDAKVAAMLKLVRLDPFADRMPAQLSGGQQQRVALARALAYDPPLLLMDEPLSALDKKLREEIQYELKRIHNETGVTILYVTHDQEEALRLSDRVALFNHGRIEQIGSGRDLYENPRTRFVAGFIGNSNFIPAAVTQRAGQLGRLTCPDGAVLSGIPIEGLSSFDREALIMVRPDCLRLTPATSAEASRSGLRGTVTDATFLGDAMHFTVTTGWGEDIIVRTPLNAGPPQAIGSGARVLIEWDAEQSRVFSSH
jgi:putative spermidine/putrescine transport system ATP-binding protein